VLTHGQSYIVTNKIKFGTAIIKVTCSNGTTIIKVSMILKILERVKFGTM